LNTFPDEIEPSFEDLLRLYKPEIELERKEKKSSSPEEEGWLNSLDDDKPHSEVKRSCKRRRSCSSSPSLKKSKLTPKIEKQSKKKKKKSKKHKEKKRSKKKKRKGESKHAKDTNNSESKKSKKKSEISEILIIDSDVSENRPPLEPIPGANVEAPKKWSLPPLEPDSPDPSDKIIIILDDDSISLQPGEDKEKNCNEGEIDVQKKLNVPGKLLDIPKLKLECPSEPARLLQNELSIVPSNLKSKDDHNLVDDVQANLDYSVCEPISEKGKSIIISENTSSDLNVGQLDNDQKSESPPSEPRDEKENLPVIENFANQACFNQKHVQETSVLKPSTMHKTVTFELQATATQPQTEPMSGNMAEMVIPIENGGSQPNAREKLMKPRDKALNISPTDINSNANLAVRIRSNIHKVNNIIKNKTHEN